MKQRTPPLWNTLTGRVALVFLYLSLISLYPGLNAPWGTIHSVAIPLDSHIPLATIFVVPYLFFFFPWIAVLLLWSIRNNPTSFGRLIMALMIGTAISYLFYFLFQTVVYRDGVPGEGAFSDLVRWVYQSDARYNAFPSTHTVTTVILLVTTLPLIRRKALSVGLISIALSIILSTLFIKQHNIADLALGVLVAGISLWVAHRIVPSRLAKPELRKIRETAIPRGSPRRGSKRALSRR